MFKIAIDGYAGSGKTTLAQELSKRLTGDFKVLYTGAIFRAYAYQFEKRCDGIFEIRKDCKTFR